MTAHDYLVSETKYNFMGWKMNALIKIVLFSLLSPFGSSLAMAEIEL
jgi:hypothetical protein